MLLEYENIFLNNEKYIYIKLIKINNYQKHKNTLPKKNLLNRLVNLILYCTNIVFILVYLKNNKHFENIYYINTNIYTKATFCSMSYPGIGRTIDIINFDASHCFTAPELRFQQRANYIKLGEYELIERLNNGSNYKKFKLLKFFYNYSSSLTDFNRVDLLNENGFYPILPLLFDSPIKPFTFNRSIYKNIYKNKFKIGLDSKIGFGGFDLLLNSKYNFYNLLKFKMGLFSKKPFYKNKLISNTNLISNNMKFFLTPSMKIGNKNISIKTDYFTAFQKDSKYLKSVLKFKKKFDNSILSLKFMYDYRFLKHNSSAFKSLAGRFTHLLFYRNQVNITNYGFLNQSQRNILSQDNFLVRDYRGALSFTNMSNPGFRRTFIENYMGERVKKCKFYDLNYVIELEKTINPNFNYKISYCFNSKKLWLTIKYLKKNIN